MKNKRERKYYYIIIAVVVVYLWLVRYFGNVSDLSTIITTVTTLIAAVTFWMQLKRSENLDEANFIMSMNDQFISNEEMTKIEHALEAYYIQEMEGISECRLDLVLDRNHEDCQKLINYLVYMEGLAALIQRDVLHLGVIGDLFAYRFFIAVNNPIVQKFELLPYANYYRGCFKLSKLWTKEWRKTKRPIPMDQYALYECDESLLNVPRKNGES